MVVGAVAAEVMADAVVRAALTAEGLPGLPAARDLRDASDGGAAAGGGVEQP
jgi:hypothetical protein